MAKILFISREPDIMAIRRVEAAGHVPIETISFKSGLEEACKLPYDSIIVAEYQNNDGNVVDFMAKLEDHNLPHRVIVHSDNVKAHDVMAAHKSKLFATFIYTQTFDQVLVDTIQEHLPGLPHLDILPGSLFQQKGAKAEMLMVSIGKASLMEFPLTISGEKGLGKERLAKAVHEQSNRRKMPLKFIRHTELLHGADCQTNCGRCYLEKCLKENDGGTIALLDIPNYCHKGQDILLNHLRNPKYNVRIVSTSDKALMKQRVNSGEFDSNLWFELSQGMIEVPPLRECPDNIEWLAQALLDQFCQKHKRQTLVITEDALSLLKAFAWPGNVTQLNSVLIRKAMLCDDGKLEVNDFLDLIEPDPLIKGESYPDMLSRILADSPTVEVAAKRMGKSTRTLYNHMKIHGIKRNGEKKLA